LIPYTLLDVVLKLVSRVSFRSNGKGVESIEVVISEHFIVVSISC
jgi:hypothetical protein